MTAPAVAAVRAVHRRSAPWPYGELDITSLRSSGRWRPTPIREVILKVHQRCNLACEYCYVYTKSDQSWRDKPKVMPREIWRAVGDRLSGHVGRHDLTSVRIILHGGEPLLLGVASIRDLVTDIRERLPVSCAVEFGLQTNGTLLTAPVLDALRSLGVGIGVSVDGLSADNDRRRPTIDGRGSFLAVRRALDLLRRPENRASYRGLLCTVDPTADPVATYEQLAAFEPPRIDLLLPHAHWGEPPPRRSTSDYGDWLVAVFDHWYASATPVRIRLFEDVMGLLLGRAGQSEQVGLSPAALVVVETDGTLEQVDSLKSTYVGACATGLDIRHDDLDALFDDPGVVARQLGVGALAAECLACPVRQVCGGGHYVHRYRPGEGFRQPSVYCEDLRRLIDHVRGRLVDDLSQRVGTVSAR